MPKSPVWKPLSNVLQILYIKRYANNPMLLKKTVRNLHYKQLEKKSLSMTHFDKLCKTMMDY